MKLFSSLGEIASKGKAALKRFPVVLTWAIVGTLFTINCIELQSLDTEFNKKIILIFSLGISWLISSRFFLEQFKKDKEWISLVTLLFLSLFYWSLPLGNLELKTSDWIRFCIYVSLGHVFVLVAPFVLLWNKESFFNHGKIICIAIVRSLFFSLILYGGISLAFLATEHLFDVNIKNERYFQIFIFCIGIINTWVYLSDFPKNIYTKTTVNYSKALEVFVKYILIPLVILYFIILYAYSLKIIINWNLPKGWVSYLVIALSFLGFIIQLLINPIQKTTKTKTIRYFQPWFYYLLLPLTGLLFVAIVRRVFEYGFTENRYIVFVLAIWILGMIVYMLLSKKKQIRYFLVSLIFLFLLTSFGFWGVFKVSTASQLKKFEMLYNNMKEKGFKVRAKEKEQFFDITRYLYDRAQLEKVAPILGFNPTESFKTVKWSWSMSNRLSDSLNLIVIDTVKDLSNSIRINFYSNFENEIFDIKDYDFFKETRLGSYKYSVTIREYQFTLKKTVSELLIVSEKKGISYTIELEPFVSNLRKRHQQNTSLQKDEMTLVKEFDKLKIKLIFKNLNFLRKDAKKPQEVELNNTNLYIFIKQKEHEFKNQS